ncbi:hypothetical protein [Mycobacterium simiae]|uniref:hypothetical protein n=1 Tax=Mycobacterium simiae TaxID=1784 RepID=UPI0011F0C237|nr:hypothetical protein [Mycobacterium simiae]
MSADAARVRGVPSGAAAPQPGLGANPVADFVAHDPALEQLRSRKVKRTGLNVHINSQVHTAFAAFIDEYELPKGDATSLAIQEFLERRGVVIPGVARVLPPPVAPDPAHGQIVPDAESASE